jgi:hypothetical protein
MRNTDEVWNEAIEAAAQEVNLSCGGLDHLLVERIRALKKPAPTPRRLPPAAYREIDPFEP